MGKIFDKVISGGFFVIAGHTNPDGDTIGACFAAALCLANAGKKAAVLLEEINERYSVIPGSEFLYRGDIKELNPDVFIALDCGDKERLGQFAKVFDRSGYTVCIDHHISNTGFADHNHIEPGISSTCEIIYKIIKKHFYIDEKIASALYAGIADDTGGFCHSYASADTYEIASELVKYKIPFSKIYNEILNAHSMREVYALKKVIENIVELPEKQITYSKVTLKEMELAGITHKDFEGTAGYLVNIRGVRAAFFVWETPDGTCRISLRSKDVNVSDAASKLGGGGHFNAAGATSKKPLEETVRDVLEALEVNL
ncbi:MAG: DHH family phosphoesterase [Clostridiales bacterium]|jgi:phosphoesterase RecJ-like protein|nr:DHH family phosphoesterase [Clostridiales bacterium]